MPINFITSPTPTVVTSGLVLYLNASNPSSYPGSGSAWTDLSVSGNNATLVNSPTFSSSNSGYLAFNGFSQYGTLSLPSTLPTGNQMSMGFWSYGLSVANTYLFCGLNGSNRTVNVHLPWGNYNVYWDCGNSGGSFNRLSTYLGTSYQGWHYWMFTKNASTGIMNIYRDNVVIGTGSGYTFSINQSDYARIAKGGPTAPEYWNGYLAQVQVYNKELNSTEITQNYNADKTKYGL